MKQILKTYRIFLALIIFDLGVLAFYPHTGLAIFRKTGVNFLQMLSVLPPIFVLLGLLEVWVPRETMMRYLGKDSGLVGILISLFMGAAAAGPLYGAFPVAATMLRKGAKFSNVMILLYSWSTLKLPMLLFETTAMGARFTVTRMLINIPGIIALAWLTSRLIKPVEQDAIYQKHILSATST